MGSVVEWAEGRGLSLRVKRDERVGVWWLDGVDVSVMAWCQTLCHCQCQSHQPIPQWSVTVQCVSKPLCLLPLQSVCWCCCVVPLLPFCPRHNTRSHTHHTPYIMTHLCTPSHANRAVCCAAFFGKVDSETHTASSTPLTPSLDITQHTPTNPTQTQLIVQATMRSQSSM